MALFAGIFLIFWTSYYLSKGRNWMRWLWVIATALTVIMVILNLQSKNWVGATQFFWVDGFLVVSIFLLFTTASNQYFKSEHS